MILDSSKQDYNNPNTHFKNYGSNNMKENKESLQQRKENLSAELGDAKKRVRFDTNVINSLTSRIDNIKKQLREQPPSKTVTTFVIQTGEDGERRFKMPNMHIALPIYMAIKYKNFAGFLFPDGRVRQTPTFSIHPNTGGVYNPKYDELVDGTVVVEYATYVVMGVEE